MKKFLFAAVAFVAPGTASAEFTDKVLNTIYVNKDVTTHLIMPETIKLVDISTDYVVGNQVNDNIVRIKPDTILADGDMAAVVTVIGERHIVQYKLVYSVLPNIVHTRFDIPYSDTQEYTNPDVNMSVAEMSHYAIRMFNAKRTVKNIHSKKDKMKAWVNHICSAGDYFFIQPTLAAAFDIKPAITSESQLALASALKAEVDPSNFGKATAVISNIYNTSSIDTSTGKLELKAGVPGVPGAPAFVIIDNEGNYEVFDSFDSNGNRNSLGVADSSCNGVNILANIKKGGTPLSEIYGYDITVNGKVFAGDKFNIEVNSNGIGDNSNGLAMCEMQTADLVASGTSNGVKQTFVERYSLLTSEFGTVVNNASANATASEAKLAQSVAQYENITGVSLDEEAANLVKFQQYYQAAARIISASQTVFDALISAV